MDKNQLNHNLQNDLAIILGLASQIQRKEISQEVRLLVDRIQKKVKQTSQTIQDILHPKKEISFKEAFLNAETDLNVNFNGSDLKIKANERKLNMLIDNILKNAKEAQARNIKISGSKTSIIIRDDGVGLSDEVLSKINSSEIFTTKANGTGLGTAFVREFCFSHNLSIKYKNNFTKGCQIEINSS